MSLSSASLSVLTIASSPTNKAAGKFCGTLSMSNRGVEYTFKTWIVVGDVERHCDTDPNGSPLSASQSNEVDNCSCKLWSSGMCGRIWNDTRVTLIHSETQLWDALMINARRYLQSIRCMWISATSTFTFYAGFTFDVTRTSLTATCELSGYRGSIATSAALSFTSGRTGSRLFEIARGLLTTKWVTLLLYNR